ncbi:TlpA family protein disulfide reductase [Flavivirga spongiicola]|uniref:TlpA family protein disulfide reductase n=1 Tax=Flavivirga spongiicola TaxID=421621 RepID=A0ABU7XZB8_9FLAO|nr:TlpA disulfide reductase family protein [Flavivirga sp. MEBiC05379]MDO5980793.1 TlpA disulfide reductase family protein [Flavivirga sp. MEBiC05379]
MKKNVTIYYDCYNTLYTLCRGCLFLLVFVISTKALTAQTLKGQLTQQSNQKIWLTSFNNYELAKTTVDSLGNFTLSYPGTYNGAGILKTQDSSSLVVMLTQANISLQGTHLSEPDNLHFINSPENQQFITIAAAYSQNQQAYKWRYLKPKYAKECLSKSIEQFRKINFNNPNFKMSGLFKDLIEKHYFLLENMGKPIDSVYKQMNISTDYLINNLKENDSLLNTVSEKLFHLFENRGLFPAAAYLSNQLLAQNQCVLHDGLANTIEKYRTLKVGNTAPDIQLTTIKKLSDFNQPVLLVFGASWCSHCEEEAPVLKKYYNVWKDKVNIEVVYISIDTDIEAFKEAYQNTPWQTYCDYKGWDTQAAKDYFVNATPTYILLDKTQKILLHPRSLEQVNTWVNLN